MNSEFNKIKDAASYVEGRWSRRPRVGIVLGSGLGSFADQIQSAVEIPYGDIPHFPDATVIGHAGRLVCGNINGTNVVALNGRFHMYEGHSAQLVSLPIRLVKELGVELLVLSNAAGGLNPRFRAGDIMMIDDQINLTFRNPLFGINDDRLGPRFPDMCCPFDRELNERLLEISRSRGIPVQVGVYAGVLGPNYETRAEIRMLRKIGADAVGMSTVPEVLAAVHGNLRVVGLSVITNVCQADVAVQTAGEHVVATAAKAEANLREMVIDLLDSTKQS